jgi:hypothetical protein
MKKWILIVLLLSAVTKVPAQSIAGNWKRMGCTLEYQDGKKEDLHKAVLAGFPCAADMQFIFKADGTHYSQSSKGCETINAMSKATWKQTGNILTLVSVKEVKANPGGTRYTLTFSGNTVTLTHVYTSEENEGVSIKVKKIVLVYQRI